MYRDEREVLRDEVFALRREVEQARADQDRLAVAEKELAAARRKLASLEKPPTQGGGMVLVAIIAGSVLVFGGALAVLLLQRSPSRAPAVAATESPPAVATPPPAETVPAVTPVPPTEVPQAPRRTAHVQWRATVTKTQGVAIAVGSSCTIDGAVVSDDDGMEVEDVVVRCGAQVLYDESGELEGTSFLDSGAQQHPGEKQGTWTYDLVFSDVGTRGPTRNQIKLDSPKKLGKVWSENLPELRVDLALVQKSSPTDVAIAE